MGFKCSECNRNTRLIDVRIGEGGDWMRRRRECSCGFRFSTAEIIVDLKRGSGLDSLIMSFKKFIKQHGFW